MTLLQCVDALVNNISVTDRQEESIQASYSNLKDQLLDAKSGLSVERVFLNGSYERDTILRPLKDIDLFAILERKVYEDEFHNLPSPQSVLTKIKNYLNGLDDYKDKVTQDRPCVTVSLSDKEFDILPCFKNEFGGYLIPNRNLNGWINTDPEEHTKKLNDVNKKRNFKVKSIIKVLKYWNREGNIKIPSYHIEEVAIDIFNFYDFTNLESGIIQWYNNSSTYLGSSKFDSQDDYDRAINKVKKVKDKLNDAHKYYTDGKEDKAIEIWKDVFGREFPTIDVAEAKSFSDALKTGTLNISSVGMLSTAPSKITIPSNKGYFGGLHKEK